MAVDELNLDEMFTDESQLEPEKKEEIISEDKKETIVEPINENNLFEAEGVNNVEGQKKEDITVEDLVGNKNTSPQENFYSTIANSFKEDGIFPDLSSEDLETVKTAEDFAELVQKQIAAKLDDTQKRIKLALDNDLEPEEVSQFEKTLNYLESLDNTSITQETPEGEGLRKQLIFQDYLNRGFSQERAKKEMEKSFNAGTDVEDAIDALTSNKEYFSKNYEDKINNARKEKEEEIKAAKKQADDLFKIVTTTEEPFPGLKLGENIRKQSWENISKPVYKDEDGNQYTAVQKYAKENTNEFQHKLGIIFTLTDGFKNLDKLVKGKVQEQTKKSIRELEHTLNSTRTNSDGSLRYVGDNDANSQAGLQLDLE